MISATHLHAMIIHFPIALLMVGFLSEVIAFLSKKEFFSQAAFYLLVLGTIGIVTAYFTGNAAGKGMDEGTLANAMELHERSGIITLWLTVVTALFYICIHIFNYNRRSIRMAGIVFFAVVIGFIGRTGYLGGQLVYKHGAGIELALPDFSDPAEN